MKKSVSDNILDFFKQHSQEEFASGTLEKMGFAGKDGISATGSTISRKCRNLAESGLLKVRHADHNGHSYYSLNTEKVKPRMRQIVIQLPDNTVRVEYQPL